MKSLSPEEINNAKESFVRDSSQHMSQIIGDRDVQVKLTIEKKRPKLPPNVMIFQSVADYASKNLTDKAMRILMYFISKAAYENFLGMDVLTIQEHFASSDSKKKLKKRTIIEAINELCDAGVLVKTKAGEDRRRNEYFVNPIAAWRGNSLARKININNHEGAQLGLFGIEKETHLLREQMEINKIRKETNLNPSNDSFSLDHVNTMPNLFLPENQELINKSSQIDLEDSIEEIENSRK